MTSEFEVESWSCLDACNFGKDHDEGSSIGVSLILWSSFMQARVAKALADEEFVETCTRRSIEKTVPSLYCDCFQATHLSLEYLNGLKDRMISHVELRLLFLRRAMTPS